MCEARVQRCACSGCYDSALQLGCALCDPRHAPSMPSSAHERAAGAWCCMSAVRAGAKRAGPPCSASCSLVKMIACCDSADHFAALSMHRACRAPHMSAPQRRGAACRRRVRAPNVRGPRAALCACSGRDDCTYRIVRSACSPVHASRLPSTAHERAAAAWCCVSAARAGAKRAGPPCSAACSLVEMIACCDSADHLQP